MENNLPSRFKKAWNVFLNRDPTSYYSIEEVSSYRPDRNRIRPTNERTIISSIINKIAVDFASIDIKHVNLDDQKRYKEERNSGLNTCLTLEANIDQTSRAFKQDACETCLEKGVIALVPVDTDVNPNTVEQGAFDVYSIRVAEILEWYPSKVKVRIYNDQTGKKDDIIVSKKWVVIMQNPFYQIMNEPNSTMQRLGRKLSILDAIDEQSGSGKLDLIIQLPYVIKTEARREQAEKRRKEIEVQLAGSKYGIAYTDGTEKITQLNRPVENNLMNQVEYLTNMLMSQLGFTQGILDGTADEKTMTNYNNRILYPLLEEFCLNANRKFISKTGRSQGQSIMPFNDPLKLIPPTEFGSLADSFTRNAILSSNEVRQKIGYAPSNDPAADELRNKNISQPAEEVKKDRMHIEEENQNGKE